MKQKGLIILSHPLLFLGLELIFIKYCCIHTPLCHFCMLDSISPSRCEGDTGKVFWESTAHFLHPHWQLLKITRQVLLWKVRWSRKVFLTFLFKCPSINIQIGTILPNSLVCLVSLIHLTSSWTSTSRNWSIRAKSFYCALRI